MKILCLLTSLVLFVIPSHALDVPEYCFNGTNDLIEMDHWLAVGPFEVASNTDVFNHNALKAFGLGEHCSLREYSDFANTLKVSGLTKNPRGPVVTEVRGRKYLDFQFIYSRPVRKQGEQSCVYLGSVIISSKPTKGWLQFGSDDGLAVFLNGKEIFNVSEKRALIAFDNGCEVNFAQGANFLLVKVSSVGGFWGARLRLATLKSCGDEFPFENSKLFARNVLTGDEKPFVKIGGLPPEYEFGSLVVYNSSNEIVAQTKDQRNYNVLHAPLDNGAYKVVHNDGSASDFLLIGGISEAHNICSLSKSKVSESMPALTAEVERLDYLLNFDISLREKDREFEKKLAETCYNVSELMLGSSSFEGRPMFRKFRSALDSSLYSYRIAIPKKSNGKKALFLLLPPVPSTQRPFQFSVYASKHDEALVMARIVNRMDSVLVWPGYRAQPYGYPIDFVHLNEVIEDVISNYDVDTDRMYLLGTCSSGITACMADLRWPSRFAGIGLLNPLFVKTKVRWDERPHVSKFKGYLDWLSFIDPSSHMNKEGCPIVIAYDGAEVGHGELVHSLDFVRRIDPNKRSVDLSVRPKENGRHEEAWGFIVRSLLNKVSGKRNDLIDKQYSVRGSRQNLSLAFTQNIYFEGKDDPKIEQLLKERIKPFTLNDRNWVSDIGSIRCQDSTLFIIKYESLKRLWAQYNLSPPLIFEDDGVVVRGKKILCANPFVEVVFDHPVIEGCKVIFVGGMATGAVPQTEFALDGWYEVGVWDGGSGAPIFLGYMDR